MIPAGLVNDLSPLPALQPSSWQDQLKSAFRTPRALGEYLELPEATIRAAECVGQGLPVFVTRTFADRMRRGDPADPLLLQVWPVASLSHQNAASDSFCDDPVDDVSAQAAPGLLHKYHGRVLLVLSGACGIHCQYCFRQNYAYSDLPSGIVRWQESLQYVESDPSITEVILSGGDPLMWTDGQLERLIESLEQIPHLKRLRIHSRMPIVCPSRVGERLTHMLSNSRMRVFLVVHSNHAREIDSSVAAAFGQLQAARVVLLNQAVLLRQVNDSVADQAELCERLVDCGVLPYYLHQLDRVRGAERFEVFEDDGLRIIEALQKILPGYAVPRYVRETAGAASKLPVVESSTGK